MHLRLPNEDLSVLDSLADNVLSRQQVATMLLHGAVESIKNNGGKIQMPPRFRVAMDEA